MFVLWLVIVGTFGCSGLLLRTYRYLLHVHNRAESRHLPQKEVFGHYLVRYSFHPPEMHIHSICLVHG